MSHGTPWPWQFGSLLARVAILRVPRQPCRPSSYMAKLGDMPEGLTKKQRKRWRTTVRRQQGVKSLIECLQDPVMAPAVHMPSETLEIDWESLPRLAEPFQAVLAARAESKPSDELRFYRKRRQVEAFAAVVQRLTRGRGKQQLTVVDFGCGTGNLVIPLAARFPELSFVGVDCHDEAIQLLTKRAAESTLGNLATWCGRIEDFDTSEFDLDLALGLHVCGEATDHVILSAVSRGRPWAVSPCCIGAVNSSGTSSRIPLEVGETFEVQKTLDGQAWVVVNGKEILLSGVNSVHGSGRVGPVLVRLPHATRIKGVKPGREHEADPLLRFLFDGTGTASFIAQPHLALTRASALRLHYPRSLWLQGQISDADFVELAAVADMNGESAADYNSLHYTAKTLVTWDRGMWAKEKGYNISLTRIPGLTGYAKDDLLQGWPTDIAHEDEMRG